MKLLFCVVLLFCAVIKAQQDSAFPDYWQNDYDSFYDNVYDDAGSNENTELKETDISRQVDSVIQDVKEVPEEQNEAESKEIDVLQDYQIEDNRSNSDDKEKIEENRGLGAEEEPMLADASENENSEDLAILPLEETQKNDVPEGSNEGNKEVNLDNDMWDNVFEEDVDPLPVPSTEDNKDILEETRAILNEDSKNVDDQPVDESEKDDDSDLPDEQGDIDRFIEETNKILGESDDAFEANDYENSDEQEQEKSEEDLFSDNNDEVEEDTPEKVYADLNADLDKLFETLDKLSDDKPETDEAPDEDDEYVDNVQDYEEKYGKPYKEDVVLSWRDAEDEADPDNANESDETVDQDPVEAKENNNPAEENEVSDEQNEMNDYENVNDSNLSDIFAENVAANSNENKNVGQEPVLADKNNNEMAEENASNDEKETDIHPAIVEKNDDETFNYMDNYDETRDSEPNADNDIDSVIQQIFSDDIKEPQSYGNDALIDDNQPKNENAQEFESLEANDTKVEEVIEQQNSVMVDELSSAELSDLMTQFAIAHSEDLDVHSENFAKHVAPIHVTLSIDEPTVITSPNYPSPYPTNNIVDWIFEGPGTGIEMNITDFAVNGALGDYLLVKPGGLDESGQDGLIFSYRLNSERRYRFADVNRMFVRFEAKPGWQFMTGFSFSVKMIWPLPELADDIPEVEAVINPPEETLTLNLAGLTLPQFSAIKEEFIELIADMAMAYIKDNDIDRGLNTTFEVTQITKTAVCNIHWPNYETCVEVTFGVPLHYEEETEPRLNAEDLDAMWTGYIVKEEFADRLRSLGITEYAIPNDRSVLMVWLVIAAGVLISMAMLAFALWRFSCFEDYTRMRAFNDTDSIQNEKRNLDLYPTPHQTLPPLYSENDYKWTDYKYDDSTRVDMGGFANKSYIRDELFDLDSDEDVITTRDRKGVISPTDIYKV